MAAGPTRPRQSAATTLSAVSSNPRIGGPARRERPPAELRIDLDVSSVERRAQLDGVGRREPGSHRPAAEVERVEVDAFAVCCVRATHHALSEITTPGAVSTNGADPRGAEARQHGADPTGVVHGLARRLCSGIVPTFGMSRQKQHERAGMRSSQAIPTTRSKRRRTRTRRSRIRRRSARGRLRRIETANRSCGTVEDTVRNGEDPLRAPDRRASGASGRCRYPGST